MKKGDKSSSKLLWCLCASTGLFIIIYSAWQVANLPSIQLLQCLALLGLTALVGSFSVFIPGSKTRMSSSEAIIFAAAILYGPAPAALLAAADGYVSSRKNANGVRNSLSSIAYTTAVMAISVFSAATLYDQVLVWQGLTTRYNYPAVALEPLTAALVLLAVTHYLFNLTSIALLLALRTGQSLYLIFRHNQFFFWVSLSYLAGASAAAMMYYAVIKIGFASIFLGLPVLLVVYLTYSNYYEKVEEKNRRIAEITKLHLSIIETLAVAIDAKDQTTHGHVRRVQTYCEELGKIFNLSDADMEALKAAAILHDVGKLAVPDYILNKPDKLTEAEFAKMKIHAEVGGEMLKNVGFPYPVDDVVRHHHERWDGKGYPDKLKGEEIPIAARILTVVDFFDATTCTRPYRTGMKEEDSIALLQQGAGTQFDPKVVETFIAKLPELKQRAREMRIPEEESSIESIKEAAYQARVPTTESRKDSSVLPPSVLDTIASAQREVYALYEIAQTFSSSLNLKDMLAIIASKLEAIVPFTSCVINLVEPQTGEIIARHIVGEHIEFFKARRYRPGVGVTGWVVANKRAMYNTTPDLDFTEPERELANKFSAIGVFPLIKGDEALGTISLYSADLKEYSVDHIRLMEIVAQQASDAINNAIIYEEAKTSAMTDLLTGLLNARAFYIHCDQEIANSGKLNQPLTLLNMDLDGFKRINDTFGHQVGDRILIQLAQVLRRQFREDDILTRYAGDEFLAILPGIDRHTATALTERIQRAVESFQYKLRDGKSITLGISIGVACYPEDGQSVEELMSQADRYMYENKKVRRHVSGKAGRGEVYRFKQQSIARKS